MTAENHFVVFAAHVNIYRSRDLKTINRSN